MAEAARVRRRKCHVYGRIVLSPSSIFRDIGIARFIGCGADDSDEAGTIGTTLRSVAEPGSAIGGWPAA
jgi:hypothetical protein